MRAIAIDFETANETRTSPCAIGLAWIEDGVVTRRAYSLVRPPEMRFASGNVRIHGIRPADVAAEADLPTVIAPHLDDLARSTVIAHNAGFDIGVLCGTLALYGQTVPRFTYLCTKALARRAWPRLPRYGLAALAERIGHVFTHHHAGEDALACARIALAAARDAGTTRIGALAEQLDVRAGQVDWPSVSPCRSGSDDRPSGRPIRVPRQAPPQGRLAFTMRGSAGQHYDVVGGFARGGYALRCSCMAGRNNLWCRHVTALLDGEITDLLSDNTYDLEKLRAVLMALGESAVYPAPKKPHPPAPDRASQEHPRPSEAARRQDFVLLPAG